ncbi:thioesterase family protein [Planctomyces sp. SH-PL62]|uniref:thioesterase family protein n=1 Tax=Planctomyces sp. SH-PL62 TaxID=1636152 RepID=UPI00078E2C9A|nr:hotdog domain-containing protein [Planctomyces sp. SH-PL62]AMV39188.1 Fluoroacetyl-CoA thioesterase [Planctomyces sp. SH-PL62]
MKQTPRTGLTGEMIVEVVEENCINFADGRMPAVLSTPWLVAYLEFVARDALAVCLEDHERSVGALVEIEHLAPSPIGARVTCRARVIHVDGPIVTFHIEAFDETEAVARGLHKRRVIDADRFARRVEKKRRPAGS